MMPVNEAESSEVLTSLIKIPITIFASFLSNALMRTWNSLTKPIFQSSERTLALPHAPKSTQPALPVLEAFR